MLLSSLSFITLIKMHFQEILLTSSFMQPLEGRNSTQTNRVRCFTKNALLSPVCDDKWDFVKLKCTQPFNKHVQYGISFVKVYCADGEPEPAKAAENKGNWLSFGKFRLRENSSDSDKDEATSSLFSKWQEKKASPDGKANGGGALSGMEYIWETPCETYQSNFSIIFSRFFNPRGIESSHIFLVQLHSIRSIQKGQSTKSTIIRKQITSTIIR